MSTEEQKRTVAQPKVKKERTYKKYTVDFNSPVENKLLSLEAAAKYLTSNIKVGGLKGKLGESVKVLTDSKNNKVKNSVQVQVDNKLKFSKRYIKYLVKKFLKREGIVKYLTVASTAPNAYTVKVLRKNEE